MIISEAEKKTTMKTLDKIKVLCQEELAPIEIDDLIRFLHILKNRKISAFQQQASSSEIPIRPGWQVLEEKNEGHLTYRRERRSCGEVNFKCNVGLLNGPYWYAYYRRDNQLVSKYIGETFRPISPISGQVKPRFR